MIKQKSFYFAKPEFPTEYNISLRLKARGWSFARSQDEADFGDFNLEFDKYVSECLEYKHLLAKLISRYCPLLMPVTYGINDNNWFQVLANLKDSVWILKPSMLNNGRHIYIFKNKKEIADHFLNPKRMGGEQVLQEYIPPHLLRDKRKYSIRQFVVLTNYGGAYLYPQGYYNVACHQYTPDLYEDLRPHLTNEHLNANEVNIIQIPSNRFPQFEEQQGSIKNILIELFHALKSHFPEAFIGSVDDRKRTIAIFGMDFMVNDTGKIWLLEANHGPCFPVRPDHPLQTYLYEDFWEALVESFILPLSEYNILTKNKSIWNKIC
jgi:tubulin--tyrosine ligase